MYKNIRKQKSSVAPLQEVRNSVVSKRKRGRPKRDNMKRYTIKMDKFLYEKIMHRAEEIGRSNSFIISEGVRLYFNTLNN